MAKAMAEAGDPRLKYSRQRIAIDFLARGCEDQWSPKTPVFPADKI